MVKSAVDVELPLLTIKLCCHGIIPVYTELAEYYQALSVESAGISLFISVFGLAKLEHTIQIRKNITIEFLRNGVIVKTQTKTDKTDAQSPDSGLVQLNH